MLRVAVLLLWSTKKSSFLKRLRSWLCSGLYSWLVSFRAQIASELDNELSEQSAAKLASAAWRRRPRLILVFPQH